MKHLRILFVAAAITMSSSLMASPAFIDGNRSLSTEIGELLANSDLMIEKDLAVRVFFRLSEEGKIQIHSVKSDNEEVNLFLRKRLEDQVLTGNQWMTDKIYMLPVKMKPIR